MLPLTVTAHPLRLLALVNVNINQFSNEIYIVLSGR